MGTHCNVLGLCNPADFFPVGRRSTMMRGGERFREEGETAKKDREEGERKAKKKKKKNRETGELA